MSDFGFVHMYELANGFFSLMNDLADFFFQVRTFTFTTDQFAPVTITTSTADLLLGGSLVFILGFRMVKFFVDIVL